MSVYVFAGPTLTPAEVEAELDAVCLPPAAQGDVLRLLQRRPTAVAIVDGVFEHVPAVWHKEILDAMARGVHVYGSASMGALRAAELAPFGMVGVGAIFEAYASGALVADDEVAVAHGPAEAGFRPLSVPLVDIRATLEAARDAGALAPPDAQRLADLARARFYAERTYERLLADAEAAGIAVDAAALTAHRVERKREDALAMLRRMRTDLAAVEPKRVDFELERSFAWVDAARRAGSDAAAPLQERILEELQLDPRARAGVLQSASYRDALLAVAEAMRAPAEDRDAVGSAMLSGLGVPEAAVDAWLEANDLDRPGFTRLVEEEARAGWVQRVRTPDVELRVLDTLRLVGAYPALRARAADKERRLADAGIRDPRPEDVGTTAAELVAWHAEQAGAPPPRDVEDRARSLGFPGGEPYVRALAREYAYRRIV